jgi:hypothetical protein
MRTTRIYLPRRPQEMSHGFIATALRAKGNPCSGSMMKSSAQDISDSSLCWQAVATVFRDMEDFLAVEWFPQATTV